MVGVVEVWKVPQPLRLSKQLISTGSLVSLSMRLFMYKAKLGQAGAPSICFLLLV